MVLWLEKKTHIASIVNQIEDLITQTPGYSSKDSDSFFEIDKDRVVEIIHLIEKTYLYTEYYQNTEFANDLTNLLCSLEYALSCAPDKNKLYCWHITKHDGTGRDLNRLRSNGAYNDSPEGGSVYIDMARNKAIDFPVITFIKESGAKNLDERGINIGWNGAEFYWPVLLTQKNISSAIYTIE